MPTQTQLLPPPSKDFNDAKRQYMEQYGSALVTNSYLRIAILCLSLVAAGCIFLTYKTYSAFRDVKPLIVRINDVGRADVVRYNSMEYSPREPELKYFLTQFVHDFYGRRRLTVRDDFLRSLYFLERQLAEATMEQNRKSKGIETFLIGVGEEVDINVRNITIHDLRNPPIGPRSISRRSIYPVPPGLSQNGKSTWAISYSPSEIRSLTTLFRSTRSAS
jgi:type IV secretory pathway TrbF-like protein